MWTRVITNLLWHSNRIYQSISLLAFQHIMLVNNSIIEKNRGEREATSLYEFRGGWLQIKRMIYGEENRE